MDRRLLLSTALSAGAALSLALPAQAQPAPNARPAGGSVVAGSATIAQSSATTTIDQSSQRAAINWQSFDVGSQQTVRFDQPSSTAVALNRVVGPNPSEIAGRIDANGQVIITNQSGVLFYKGSQVNTAGLMVTAAGIGNADFMAGRMVFDQAAHPNAAVVNQGSITVRGAGLAALVAPQVANSGVINARLGHVALAGAEKATLDLYGDGLMSIDVTAQVVQAPNGATALVTNSGIIRADGGTVQLTARAADGIVQTLVDAGGTIRANTAGGQTGSIVLNGVGGSITIAGQLTATGTAPGSTGGAIEADASGNVILARTARIDASGTAGGGVVAIGTTLARATGGGSVTATQTAANVTMAKGATITANATAKGNGGRVAVLSRGRTALNGTISATGGLQGGNGGFVETSGNRLSLGPAVSVDTSARLGQTGTWLLDPANFTIANSGGDETPLQVVDALATNRVFIQADNDITVSDVIDATTNSGATNSLILEAGRSIAINNGITLNGGNFFATANDSFDLPGTSALPDRAAGAGSFTMAAGATIDTSVAAASLNITVDQEEPNTGGGGAFLPGVISLTNLSTGGGQVNAFGGSAITLSGVVAAGTGTVELGAGDVAVNGPVNADRVLMFTTTGGVTQDTAGIITAPALGIESAGSVDLEAANAVNTLAATVSDSGASLLFRNAGTPLTVGTVIIPTDNPTFIVGITTNDGKVALATTGSGDVRVNQPISSTGTATGGEIDIAVAPGSAFINNSGGAGTDLQTFGTLASGGGNIVILADAMSFTPTSTVAAGGGTVVLGPATTTDSILLGGTSNPGTLGLQSSDLATIGAGMVEIGYRAEDATASFTGGISVGGAGITLSPTVIPTLLLVTGGSTGTVSQTAPITFSAAGGTLGIIAGGNVTLNDANAVSTFAGFTDNTSTISFTNDGPLTIGALPADQLGVAVSGTGLASSAPMSSGTGLPGNPLTGLTAIGGGSITVTTSAGNLTLADSVTAAGQTVTLESDGTINQTGGVVTAGTLTGSSVGGASLPLGNLVVLFGSFTDTGAASTGITFTDAQTLGTAGTVSSASGPITLTTTGTGSNLTLAGDVTASGNTVTLDSAGTIGQTGGVVSAATLTGQSVAGASLTQGNLVSSLGTFADTGPGSTGISFADARALGVSGTLSSASGPITLTTAGAGSNLTLGAAVTAGPHTVTLDSAGTIEQTAGVITAGTLTGRSVGGASLAHGNEVPLLGAFTDTGAGSTGISFTDAEAVATTATVSSASGPITLATTGAGSSVTLGAAVTADGNKVTLDSAATIEQTGGVITAATLTGASVDGTSLTQGNLVASLGAFADTGSSSTGISFTDARVLGTTGTVSSISGPVTLTTTGAGSNLTLGGEVIADGQTETLVSAGTINQTAGAIDAGTLTGSSAGGTTLAQDNAIGTLGPFAAASLALFDGGPLTIDGPVDANFLTITATGHMTLAGNITTIGAPLSQQPGPTPAPGGSTLQVLAARANFEAGAQFVQTGTSILTDPPGTTLRIQLPANGGTATFANLDGPGANIVLGLGTGTATGTMEVGGLLVLGQAGSAGLFGSVNGVTTRAAAALGQIIPSVNPNYTFNNCVIGATFCGAPTQTLLPPFLGLTTILTGPALAPVPPLPALSLFVLVTPPLLAGELAPQDVVPPNISFEDY